MWTISFLAPRRINLSPLIKKTIFTILIGSLSMEGLLLLFMGWWIPVPEVSTPVRLVGLSWLLVCVTTSFINKKPYLQIALVWLRCLILIWSWWLVTEERAPLWFLFQNIFPLTELLSSHSLVLLGRKPKKSS